MVYSYSLMISDLTTKFSHECFTTYSFTLINGKHPELYLPLIVIQQNVADPLFHHSGKFCNITMSSHRFMRFQILK